MSTLSFVGVHSLNDVSIFSKDIRNISFMLNNDPSNIDTNKPKAHSRLMKTILLLYSKCVGESVRSELDPGQQPLYCNIKKLQDLKGIILASIAYWSNW